MKVKWAENAQEKETGRGCPKGRDGPRKPKSKGMGQGSPKQYEYQPNGNTRPQELSKGKVYSRPKKSQVSTGHTIAQQE